MNDVYGGDNNSIEDQNEGHANFHGENSSDNTLCTN